MTVQIGKLTEACNTYLQQTEEALLSASAAATTHVAKFHLHAAEMLAQLNHCNSRNSYYHKLAKLPWDSTTVAMPQQSCEGVVAKRCNAVQRHTAYSKSWGRLRSFRSDWKACCSTIELKAVLVGCTTFTHGIAHLSCRFWTCFSAAV